jgi:ATP-dependent DNA helicase PIF1
MLKQKLSRVAKERWQRTAVIIVDEVMPMLCSKMNCVTFFLAKRQRAVFRMRFSSQISMLDADMFEKLDDVARYVRRSELPFGGVQLVLVGDFLQLPPVSKGQETCFCFESRVWGKTITMHVELKKVFRQDNQEFVDMLNEIRWGRCSQKIAQILQRTSMNNLEKSDVKALQLFPKNREVDSINETALKEIKEEATVFEARDTGDYPFIDQLQKNCLAPSRLELKVGCQVMLLKNLDASRGLINGARGVVKEFQYHDDPEAKNSVVISPYVEFETSSHGVQGKIMVEEDFNIEIAGKLMACRTQLPLRLAYAITIHKCQGMTLNKVLCLL